MKKEFIDLYRKITDRVTFKLDEWYLYPKDALISEFIEWFYKDSGCLEFSENREKFKVTAWPTKATIRSFIGETSPPKKIIETRYIKHTHVNQDISNKSGEILGYCARPDIVEKILAKENKKVDRSKQIAAEEFRKQKEEFFSQKPKSVFDDF